MLMINKVVKIVKKLCLAFVMLYGLNLILASIDVFIPINVITLIVVTLLGTPSILGLVVVFFLI